MVASWGSSRAGSILKTDLFDEASGPFNHAADLEPRFRFVGVDRDAVVVKAARERLGPTADCLIADVRQLPFARDCFVGIFSPSTLDHFEDKREIRASLSELLRVVSARGRLFLLLDNPWNIEVALRRALPDWLVSMIRTDQFALGETLSGPDGTRWLDEVGFSVLRTDYLLHLVRYPSIRLMAWLDRPTGRRLLDLVLRIGAASEGLARLPTRFLTGHYVGWVATKQAKAGGATGSYGRKT